MAVADAALVVQALHAGLLACQHQKRYHQFKLDSELINISNTPSGRAARVRQRGQCVRWSSGSADRICNWHDMTQGGRK